MKRRAAVWKGRVTGRWWAAACPDAQFEPAALIEHRAPVGYYEENFPSYEAAIRAALAEVGLTETYTEKETNR